MRWQQEDQQFDDHVAKPTRLTHRSETKRGFAVTVPVLAFVLRPPILPHSSNAFVLVPLIRHPAEVFRPLANGQVPSGHQPNFRCLFARLVALYAGAVACRGRA